MATKVNFYENYGDKSARERAELIYSNYSSFQGIIEDRKMRLNYENLKNIYLTTLRYDEQNSLKLRAYKPASKMK